MKDVSDIEETEDDTHEYQVMLTRVQEGVLIINAETREEAARIADEDWSGADWETVHWEVINTELIG